MARNLPFEEQVRVRAYEIFLERGGNGGSPEQDWLQAEAEVRQQTAGATPSAALDDADTRPGKMAVASRSNDPGPDGENPPRRSARNMKSSTASRRSH